MGRGKGRGGEKKGWGGEGEGEGRGWLFPFSQFVFAFCVCVWLVAASCVSFVFSRASLKLFIHALVDPARVARQILQDSPPPPLGG